MSIKVYKEGLSSYGIKANIDKTYDQAVAEITTKGDTNDDFLKFVKENYEQKVPKEGGAEFVKQNFVELAKAAACGVLHNTDTVGSEVINNIAKSGIRIDKWVKFGKSRKTYKSIKIPKYLLGNVKFKKKPAPSMNLMQIVNFIWGMLDTGVSRPPSMFIRMAMAYLRDLGNVPAGPVMTNDYTRILMALDSQLPGLLYVFTVWKKASKEWKTKVLTAQKANSEKKKALLVSVEEGFKDPEASFANFISAIQGIGANLISKAKLKAEEIEAFTNEVSEPKPKPGKLGKASVFTIDVGTKGPIVSNIPVGTEDTTLESVIVKKNAYKKQIGTKGDYYQSGIVMEEGVEEEKVAD